jgi:hypothetical protein
MSPCETSALDPFLEHPAEAFTYFKKNGVTRVICEEKHMGSRAVIVLCRNAETARTRFGIDITEDMKGGLFPDNDPKPLHSLSGPPPLQSVRTGRGVLQSKTPKRLDAEGGKSSATPHAGAAAPATPPPPLQIHQCTGSGKASPLTINLEETGLRFLELLAQYQPPEFHLSRSRRFFSFFCDNVKWGTHLKNQLNRAETLSGVEQAWRGYFSEQGEERMVSALPLRACLKS